MEKSNLDQNYPVQPVENQAQVSKPASKSKLPLILIVIFVLLVILGSGVYYYINNSNLKNQISNPQLKSQNLTPTQTVSLSTDPTANWKTYTNNTYRFQISYPENWTLNSPENRNQGLYQEVSVGRGGTTLMLYLPNNPDGDKFDVEMTKKEDINFGNIKATFNYYTSTVTKQLSAYSYIPSKYPIKTINFYLDDQKQEDDLKIIKQILSTFKFTDQNEVLTEAETDQIISLIADKWNRNPNEVKIGKPIIKKNDWIAVNAGIIGSAAGYIFQKNNSTSILNLVFVGQECPPSSLIKEKEIPEEILISIIGSNCK